MSYMIKYGLVSLSIIVLSCLLSTSVLGVEKALFLVNNTNPDIYSSISANLDTYITDVYNRFGIEVEVIADDFYHSYSAADVRDLLRTEYYTLNNDIVGVILAGTIPYATYRHGDGSINPAPLYYEDFEAQWVDSNPADGHFEQVITDEWTNATEIWSAWWIPPTSNASLHAAYLNAYLEKLAAYYSGQIEGQGSLLMIGSNMTNLGFNTDWVGLTLESASLPPNEISHLGVYSSDQNPMWGYAGVSYWVYPQNLLKPRYWSGNEWLGFTSDLDFTIYEHPYGSAEDVRVDEMIYLWNQTRFKHTHLFCHGGPDAFYFDGSGNYFTYANVSLIQQYGSANFITTSGCNNGNFRGTTGTTVQYDHSVGNVLLFSDNTCCVTYYGSASSQSTALFADYHEKLFEGLRPVQGNYVAEGYYQMRNSDIVWGSDHYFFRSVDDKILMGNPFVTLSDNVNATPVPTATITPTPTATATPDTSRLYLNALYLVQHNNPVQGGNRYYQDTIIRSVVPTSGWDGGLMDISVIEGYYDFGLGFTAQGSQIDPSDVLDAGSGFPQWESRGSINGTGVSELDTDIHLANRATAINTPYDATSHAAYISGVQMRKRNLNLELHIGKNQFTIVSPSALELSTTGLIGAFLSHDPNGTYFQTGAAPSLVCLDNASGQGATADAAGQYVPNYPGMQDVGYFQASNYLVTSDSRAIVIDNFRVTVTYLNVAGDIAASGLSNGLMGHGAPGWIANGNIGYNSIDGDQNDCIVYLELTVSWINTPTPTPYFTATRTPTCTPTKTPQPSPTQLTHPLYLNDLYFVQENPEAQQGDNRYYQDTIVQNLTPTSGWDNGLMDLAVIDGYFDLGTEYAHQGGQIPPDLIKDAEMGKPTMMDRGSINGTTVYEIDRAIPIINRPSVTNIPYDAETHAEYITFTHMTKSHLNRELFMGRNRFTIISPSAMELGATGLIGLFISADPSGLSFTSGAAPTLASRDNIPFWGATADAGGQFVPGHPGQADVGYFRPSTVQLTSDSRTTIIGDYRLTITYFNAAGDITSAMGFPGGLTGHGAPGWVLATDIGYNSIDGDMADCIAYLEVNVEPRFSPTPTVNPNPVPAQNTAGLFLLLTGISIVIVMKLKLKMREG